LFKWRCRSLRIAFNPNEPKPPTLSPSKIKDLTVGGFGVFRLIFWRFDGALMELSRVRAMIASL